MTKTLTFSSPKEADLMRDAWMQFSIAREKLSVLFQITADRHGLKDRDELVQVLPDGFVVRVADEDAGDG